MKVTVIRCKYCDNVQLFDVKCTLAWYECTICSAKIVTGFEPGKTPLNCEVVNGVELKIFG